MPQKYCLKIAVDGEDEECKSSSTQCFLLNKERFLIGNASHCDIKVKSDAPEHAVIFQGFARWFLKKTSNKHKVIVNHEAMNNSNGYHLKEGDIITLGCNKLTFSKYQPNHTEIFNSSEEIAGCNNDKNVNLGQNLSQEEESGKSSTITQVLDSEFEDSQHFTLPKSSEEIKKDAEFPEKYLKLEKDYNLNQRYIESLESDIEELHKYYKSAFNNENEGLISKLKKLEKDYELSQSYVASLESDYEELRNIYEERHAKKIEELEMELRTARVKYDNFCTESMVERSKLTLAIWQKDTEVFVEKELSGKLRIQLENLNNTLKWTLYQKNYLETKLSNLEKSSSQSHKEHSNVDDVTQSKMRAKFRELCKQKYHYEKVEQDLKEQLKKKELENSKLISDISVEKESYKQEAIGLRKRIEDLESVKDRLEKDISERKFQKERQLNAKLALKEQELAKKISELEVLGKKYEKDLADAQSKMNSAISEKVQLKLETDSKLKNLEETLIERNTKLESETKESAKLRTQIEELRSQIEEVRAANSRVVAGLIKDYMKKLAFKDKQIGDLKFNLTVPGVPENELEKLCQKDKEIQRLKDSELLYESKLYEYKKQVHQFEVAMLQKEKTLDAFRFSTTSLRADLNIQKRASEESLSKEVALHLETKDKLNEKQKEVVELYQVFQNLQTEFQENFMKHMENELNCAVCSDLLNEAITLNCTHTFCSGCIAMWKQNKNECPICRSVILHEVKVPAINNFIEKAKAEKLLISSCTQNTSCSNLPVRSSIVEVSASQCPNVLSIVPPL